jgi:hypothetical protein
VVTIMKNTASKTPGPLNCLATILLIVAAVSAPLAACKVPVFRYALKKWLPDSYTAVVFHRGSLSKDQSAVCKGLVASAKRANLIVQTVDLNEDRRPWAPEFFTSGDLPWMVLLKPLSRKGLASPKNLGAGHMVWSGSLDKASVGAMIDSPKRRKISDLIRSGQSVVWVLLDSGDAKKDAAAATRTTGAIAKLAGKLKIVKPLGPEAMLPRQKLPQLRLAFSMLRVSRADPAERALVEMLLSSGKGLRDATGPILFPIFGRGRVPASLVDKEITEENVTELARYLTGPCSCQVKAQSASGLDVLIAADWDTAAKPAPTTRPAAAPRPSPKTARK